MTYQEHKERLLADPQIRAEYESMEAEYALIRAIVAARAEQGMTQKDLAEKTGIPQANISRIENGSCNPSLNMMKRLAAGLGKTLHIDLI